MLNVQCESFDHLVSKVDRLKEKWLTETKKKRFSGEDSAAVGCV